MTEGQLTNGHDKAEAELGQSIDLAHDAIALRGQITELQINAARNAERATVEAMTQQAMQRYVKAMEKGDHQTAIEATREIFRLELYLSRRGFV